MVDREQAQIGFVDTSNSQPQASILGLLLPTALLAVALPMLAGCAFGGGAGLGLSVDTRGAVAILATAQVQTWGIRAEPNESPRHETAAVLMPMQVSAGYEFNPQAFVLAIDTPGVGLVANGVDDRQAGFAGSLHMRAQMRWVEGESDTRFAMGGSLHLAWLPAFSVSQLPRLEARPEWPDGWRFHSIGPAADISVLADDNGTFASFLVGAQYQYLEYFYLGL